MAEKFRSLDAFRRFEQRTLGHAADAAAEEVSALRVLGVLKRQPGGLNRSALSKELGVELAALEPAVQQLLREELARVKVGPFGEDLLLAV